MTVNEAQDIARECIKAAKYYTVNAEATAALNRAAEAIEYLLEQLEDAERYAGDFEWGQEP